MECIRKIDLTEGPILSSLFKMALPIMATSFIQMAYNMTDMIWIGLLGSDAVAAVGMAGFFIWLSNAFILLSKTGTEVRVAQATGFKDDSRAEALARTGLHMTAVIAVFYTLALVIFRKPLIAFFNTKDLHVENMALSYLLIIALFMFFPFCNQVFSGIFNGRGDSKTPFRFHAVGLVINMILDPVLIFGVGPVPRLGVVGAAVATIIAQGIVFSLFWFHIKYRHALFEHFKLLKMPTREDIHDILMLGMPPAIQSGLFTGISMVIARLVAVYGPVAIAVQKVGSQIEAISWMTATGFAVALGAFTGQNYGAKKIDRVLKGYQSAIKIAIVLGLSNTALLFFGSKPLFMIFIREPEAISLGVDYLRILALSQLFMCIEITLSGVFNGIGRTKPAAVTSIVFNLARIPMAIYFSQYTYLGLNGIWWSITISSVFKGVIVWLWFEYSVRAQK